MKNDGRHNPCQPDWHCHSHENSDVFRLAVVIAKVPRLDRKTTYKQNQENLKTQKRHFKCSLNLEIKDYNTAYKENQENLRNIGTVFVSIVNWVCNFNFNKEYLLFFENFL